MSGGTGRRDGYTRERGRPARILFLWPSLCFTAMLQAAVKHYWPG